MHTQVPVRFSELPLRFQESSYGQSLDPDDVEPIFVPSTCVYFHGTIEDDADLVKMIHTSHYWGLSHTPVEVYRYCRGISADRIAHLLDQVPGLDTKPMYLEIDALAICREVGPVDKDKIMSAGPRLLEFVIAETKVKLSRMWTISAAACGRIDCMRVLRSHGCPWTVDATMHAADRGNLELLQYLFDFGCPRDRSSVTVVRRRGHAECMRFLLDTNCPST